MTETDIVLATFPENPGLSDEMFSKYPSLKSADVADLVVALLAQPQRVQMQDLKVTHTLSKWYHLIIFDENNSSFIWGHAK